MSTDFDIPEGKAFVLVDLVTGLFPQLTMDTLDARYPGGSNAFVHNQTTAAATWIIPHTLGRIPSVDVYVDGESIDTDVIADTTTVTITFPSPIAGIAVLN